MTPQHRDRWMQVFLAQARGPVRNGELMLQSMARALHDQAVKEGRPPPMNDYVIETLIVVVDALDALNIVYAVTGSVASAVHGEPFSSMDADLVVLASAAQAAKIAELLQPRFYAPVDMFVDAQQRHSFANVVDQHTSAKVDLSFVGDDPYLNEVLQRRVLGNIGKAARQFWLVTPEDVILMKLLWRKDTRSAKQWENALSVARVQGARMDWKYLFDRARRLGVENDLIALRDEAGI